MNFPPPGYPPQGFPQQPPQQQGWPQPQVMQPGMVPPGAQPQYPGYPPQQGFPPQGFPQQAPPGYPPAFGQPPGMPPGMPPPNPVPMAPTTLAQYQKVDDAAVAAALAKASADNANSRPGGPKPTFVKVPGPMGQLKWDHTVPVNYENYIVLWLCPAFGPGAPLFVEQESHFFRSPQHPKGTSIEHAKEGCQFCIAALQAKGATWNPDLQKRGTDWSKLRRKYIWNVINLSNLASHWDQSGQVRAHCLDAGPTLQESLSALIKELNGASNLVDYMIGRPIKLVKKKTGVQDMDVEYRVAPASMNGPMPLPQEAYPVTHGLWDLQKLIYVPSPEQVQKAIQEAGLVVQGMPQQPGYPPSAAFQGQPQAPWGPPPMAPQGFPQQAPQQQWQGMQMPQPQMAPPMAPPQAPWQPPQQAAPAAPAWTPPPAPQGAPAPAWTPPQAPVGAPPPGFPPQQSAPPAPQGPPPMMQPPPPYNGAGGPPPPQQMPPAGLVPPQLTSAPAPGAPPYAPQPSQAGAPAAPQGPTSVPPPVTIAPPGAPAQQGHQGFMLRLPLDPNIKLPGDREMCFGRPNMADRICQECPQWIQSQCTAQSGVQAPSAAPQATTGLDALQQQLAGR